ncbi:DUF2786 domain-containing protein [Stappia sp. F7233]|uniref:DUF2786 domain-containing protein n=1 Tax=Stappia albiluteola TaxID=2758565 RepID=A0A839AF01_9HYPH|nr:DUF2786 domain-containing protein [Stappia albiluteola]MBA5777472.1 DUF2786 domain-containing protein [Stappia albiluteola]MBA5777510.1 DUF2786 domain-containing protein [Stappia albiluteola]MBA5778079.1 DUF2786 domain-containing protein [Stappia albiluteola]MBA5778144.1 DUF2786 domain-containing protein [Stappia albiluteola]
MTDKAILAKIRKCLALAQSANENEAAIALSKARELMEAHGVTEAKLAMSEVEEASARGNRSQRPPRWETILSNAVCRALAVECFLNADGDRTFVGRGAVPEIAAYAFAVLFRRLKGARAGYIRSHLKRCKPGRKRLRADIYCEAWTAAVYVKISALLPEPQPDALVALYLAERHPNLVPVKSRIAQPKGGGVESDFLRGRHAGSSVELNSGIGSGIDQPLALT